MSDLKQIPGIKKLEIRDLGKQVRDRNAFEATLDKDDGIQDLAVATGLHRDRVIALLSATLCRRGDSLTLGWLTAHWFDIVLTAIVVSLVALAPIGTTMQKHRAAAAANTPIHAVAKRGIASYVPLKLEDLEVANAATPEARDDLLGTIVGRYATQSLTSGEMINVGALSANKAELAGHSVIRVALKQPPAVTLPAFPISARLLLASRDVAKTGMECPILLLHVETDGLTGVIGIPEDQVDAVTALLGLSDAYLLFSGSGSI